MLRIIVILAVTVLGMSVGALVGLIGGAAFVEFAKQSCNGSGCADIVIQTCIPIASTIGAALGFTKGVNLVSGRSVPALR